MAIQPDLTGARVALNRLMADTCRITRKDGLADDALDDVTGLLSDLDAATTVYKGKCKLRFGEGREMKPGGREELVFEGDASIPWDAALPKKGDLLEVLSSGRDKEMVGKVLIITGTAFSTFLVARRMTLRLLTEAPWQEEPVSG